MHVQFVGLPAAGKSSIVNALVERFPERYVKGQKRYQSGKALLLRNPGLAIAVFFALMPIMPLMFATVVSGDIKLKLRIQALMGIALNYANYLHSRTYCQQAGKIVLWDELLLQRALSLFAYSENKVPKQRIVDFANWCRKSVASKVVFILIDRNYGCRLYKRGLPTRMSSFSKDKVSKLIENHRKVLDTIMNIENGACLVDSAQDIEACIMKVDDYLTNGHGVK